MFAGDLSGHTRPQSITALALTIALHVVFLMLLLSKGTPGGTPAGTAGGDASFVVNFVALSPTQSPRKGVSPTENQSVNESHDPTLTVDPSLSQNQADTSKMVVVPDAGEQVQRQRELDVDKDNSEASPASAASAAGASAHGSQQSPTDGYLMAVRQAITARWAALHPDEPLPSCTLRIQQVIGGAVTTTQAGDCALDMTKRRALEAAALMAQPLPYVGYEQSFSSDLTLAF